MPAKRKHVDIAQLKTNSNTINKTDVCITEQGIELGSKQTTNPQLLTDNIISPMHTQYNTKQKQCVHNINHASSGILQQQITEERGLAHDTDYILLEKEISSLSSIAKATNIIVSNDTELTQKERDKITKNREYAKQLLKARVFNNDNASKVYVSCSQSNKLLVNDDKELINKAAGGFILEEPVVPIVNTQNIAVIEKDEELSNDEFDVSDNRKRRKRRLKKPLSINAVLPTNLGCVVKPHKVDSAYRVGECLNKNCLTVEDQSQYLLGFARMICDVCKKIFNDSFLRSNFDVDICDLCKDLHDAHAMITRSDAKTRYLLNDVDLDLREPRLRFILKPNPHNTTWGDMRLYLEAQIAKRAEEVWGDEEAIEAERTRRADRRETSKLKQFEKKILALRQQVRSSVYSRTTENHTHTFDDKEEYDADTDTYSKTCTQCGYVQNYETL